MSDADAVVVGAGPNGLVAANVLADAGWSVLVLEANDTPGGAVRTAEVTAPGFRNDLFSAFYPLGVASPPLLALELERHGLEWRRAPLVVAHPTPDGPTALLSTDGDETAASLDRFSAGDGDGWRALYQQWLTLGDHLIDALLQPFPPIGPGVRMAAGLGPAGLLDLGRLSLLPVRRLAEERFGGAGGGLLLAGNALHTDLGPESTGGALFGLLLCGLGQQRGFPVPAGGAQSLTDALVRRLEERGGRVECGARVTGVDVRGGRAVGVTTADGARCGARRAVLADVGAPALFTRLLAPEHVPARWRSHIERFEYGSGTVKVDWALDGPVPWIDAEVGRAGTVHVADSLDELTQTSSELARGLLPGSPFLVLGQMTTADPSRSPAGTEAAWAYAHVPRTVRGDAGPDGLGGGWDAAATAGFVARMEARVERLAPGFSERILARHVLTPPALEAADANLVGGEINGGTAQLHQQLVFRPVPGLGRPTTPVDRLYLASASAHPGGGVHGACGANAARAALARDRRTRRLVAAGAALAGAGLARRALASRGGSSLGAGLSGRAAR
ncbi:MAG: NAD(P)/FAD-dependent oxidoreductase [Acidimicrobiales bacterium]|nr:NAD(P)/FAD-dependent oxidoreductase [Acidimicrobiales bacterium]MCB9373211.1 NAD(P)/FAD-dependent oxidoreductase [Microthrixaceae bacterium]